MCYNNKENLLKLSDVDNFNSQYLSNRDIISEFNENYEERGLLHLFYVCVGLSIYSFVLIKIYLFIFE